MKEDNYCPWNSPVKLLRASRYAYPDGVTKIHPQELIRRHAYDITSLFYGEDFARDRDPQEVLALANKLVERGDRYTRKLRRNGKKFEFVRLVDKIDKTSNFEERSKLVKEATKIRHELGLSPEDDEMKDFYRIMGWRGYDNGGDPLQEELFF